MSCIYQNLLVLVGFDVTSSKGKQLHMNSHENTIFFLLTPIQYEINSYLIVLQDPNKKRDAKLENKNIFIPKNSLRAITR
jgi:hypothetical protein